MPYILAQGIVLVLVFEVELVLWLLGWVFHALCHGGSHLSPIGAVLLLVIADRGGALTVGSGVIEFGCGSVCESDLVGFTDTSVDLIHREGIFYFCHFVFGIGLLYKQFGRLCRGGGLRAFGGCIDDLPRFYRHHPRRACFTSPMGDTTAALQPYPLCRGEGLRVSN